MSLGASFSKISLRMATFFRKTRTYGFPVAIWDLLFSQKERFPFLAIAVKKKHEAILNWLNRRYEDFVREFAKNPAPAPLQSAIPNHIWICWWDGADAMPPLVKACYNSVITYSANYKVVLITKDNFAQYCTIPEHIIEKLHRGIITLTHFSDILRMTLLAEYGGLWLDATVLVTGTIALEDMPLFTVRRDFGGDSVSMKRWTGNCIGGAPGLSLFVFTRDFFFNYWKNSADMIDYFLIDYVIALGYEKIFEIKKIVDDVPQNNKFYMVLQDILEEEYNENYFRELTDNAIFHKLTWKKAFPITVNQNKLTYYGYVVRLFDKPQSCF